MVVTADVEINSGLPHHRLERDHAEMLGPREMAVVAGRNDRMMACGDAPRRFRAAETLAHRVGRVVVAAKGVRGRVEHQQLGELCVDDVLPGRELPVRKHGRPDLNIRYRLAAEIMIAQDGEERHAHLVEGADAIPLCVILRGWSAGVEGIAGNDDGVERRAGVKPGDAASDAVRSFAGVADDGDAQNVRARLQRDVRKRRAECERREEQIDCRDHAAGEDFRA